MVAHSGSTLTHEASLKAKCYEEANAFCAARGLVMVPVSTAGRDGNPVPFGKGASCELVFKAVVKGSPEDVQPASGDRDEASPGLSSTLNPNHSALSYTC